MAKEPGERYASCGEFTDALRDALALPAYRPPPPCAIRPQPGTLAPRSTPPAHPATVSDGPTQDIAAPGQRLRPGPGPDGKPARRRRYIMITFAGTFLAAGTAISLLLVAPGASRPPAGPHGGTSAAIPAASKKKTAESATSTASGKTAKPAAALANADSRGVRSVAFGPGTTLAAGDANGRIYLWDTATGKLTGHLTDPGSKGVNTVRFGPGGTSLASPAGADRVRSTSRPGFLQPAARPGQDGGRGPRRGWARPGRRPGHMPGPDRAAAGGVGARVLTCNRAIAGCPHPLSPRCRDSGYRVKGKVPNGPVVAPAGNVPAARSRWSSAVCRRPDPLVRTAAASARREPASTTSFLALVTPV